MKKGKKEVAKKADEKWENSVLKTYEKPWIKTFLGEMQLPSFDESFTSSKLM